MKPIFNGTQIASIDSLAAMLGVTSERLNRVVSTIPSSYKSFDVETGKNRKKESFLNQKRLEAYSKK